MTNNNPLGCSFSRLDRSSHLGQKRCVFNCLLCRSGRRRMSTGRRADPASDLSISTAWCSDWEKNLSMVLRPLCSPINRHKPRFSPHGRALEMQHNGKLIDDHGSASNGQGDSCLDCLCLIRLKHFGVVSKAETCCTKSCSQSILVS